MCSLITFPLPPLDGKVTVCELNGSLVTSEPNDDTVERYKQMLNYPEVATNKDSKSAGIESNKSAFIEQKESAWKRIYTAWNEGGNSGVLQELTGMKDEVPAVIYKAVCGALWAARCINSLHGSIFPHLLLSSEDLIREFSQTLDWSDSAVKAFSWHSVATKYAVAFSDDVVRVYSRGSELVPTLKHKLQKCVADVAWKPLSASELAVACQTCVLIWHIDPNSLSTKPSTGSVQVLNQPGHAPVTCLVWCPQGELLLTSSPADTAMMIWNVAMEECTPVRRVGGGGVSFVKWSPDGSKVFAATPSSLFRVWETRKWACEKWSNLDSKCQAACWSTDGSTLLFATSSEPMVYSLRFNETQDIMEDCIGGARNAVLAIDLPDIICDNEDGGIVAGGLVQSMCWDSTDERLAIQFKGETSRQFVALFRTKIHPVLDIMPCGFICGDPGLSVASICFQPKFENGALLTVVWADGDVSFIPLFFLRSDVIPEEGLCLTRHADNRQPTKELYSTQSPLEALYSTQSPLEEDESNMY